MSRNTTTIGLLELSIDNPNLNVIKGLQAYDTQPIIYIYIYPNIYIYT